MNLEGETVLVVTWKEPQQGKPVPLGILYVGDDVGRALELANAALDAKTIDYYRVVRGGFPSGGQLMARGSKSHQSEPMGPTLPPTGAPRTVPQGDVRVGMRSA